MKQLIGCGVALAWLTTAAWAQVTLNVTFNSGFTEHFVNSSSASVPNGNLVSFGYFTSGFDPVANANDLATLHGSANWHEFGLGLTISTHPISGQTGWVGGGPVTSTDPQFAQQKIYLWVWQTSDSLAPSPSLGNVDYYGLFSSDASAWKFPKLTDIPASTTIAFSEVNQFIHSSRIDATTYQIEPVPEPAAYAWITGLGLGVLAWIRKTRLAK